jgi:hypothetical protein
MRYALASSLALLLVSGSLLAQSPAPHPVPQVPDQTTAALLSRIDSLTARVKALDGKAKTVSVAPISPAAASAVTQHLDVLENQIATIEISISVLPQTPAPPVQPVLTSPQGTNPPVAKP